MKTYILKKDVEVKNKPSEDESTLVGAYGSGQPVKVDLESVGWAHTSSPIDGWFYMYDNSTGGNSSLIVELSPGDAVNVPPEEASNGGATTPNNPEDKSVNDNGNEIVNANNYNTENSKFETFMKSIGLGSLFNDDNSGMDLKVSSIRGIFGCPYQFMPEVDPREYFNDTVNDKPGVIYLDKIISRIPLLIMVPGEPVFLPDGSDDEKRFFLDLLNGADTSSSAGKTMEETLTSKPIKYYGLKPMWDKYYRDFVDPMLNAVATFMNLRDVPYFGSDLGSWSWENNLPNELNIFSAYRGGVAFYLNAESSFSEGFNNSSTPSALLSKVNSLSDIGREINFIMGSRGEGTTMGKIHDIGKDIGASAGETTQKMMPEGLLGALASGISSTVIQGGKLMFPEIWSDSSYSRDYSINLKLVSPDNDDYSIFLNILAPLVHIIALVAPHNVDVNGYISPFIVRVFYKGVFSCPMGLIQSVSFTKGGEGNWSQSGLPTVVDVSISIKELYSTMSIGQSGTGMEVNTSQMDYLANLCGINIMEPDLRRQFYLWNTLHGPDSIIRQIKGLDDRLIREATYQFQRIFSF